MTLIFSQLTGQIEAMGKTLAQRYQERERLAQQARGDIARWRVVTAEMREKIQRARHVDSTWRGAEPLGNYLDERHAPAQPWQPATVVATDGSQIYPDPAGIAIYYLINVGGIILQSGSGATPDILSRSEVHYTEDELYDSSGSMVETAEVSAQREEAEIRFLAELVETERRQSGNEFSTPIIALTDGPLLLWAPQKGSSKISRETQQRVVSFTKELLRLQSARALPAGYIDRPRSASVLRTLHVIQLPMTNLTTDRIRANRYGHLADREIFSFLGPNERSGLWRNASPLNDAYAKSGQDIHFFYLNVAPPDSSRPNIVRVEVPAWLAENAAQLDCLQQTVYHDAQETPGYPYVLIRAHEIAIVTHEEQRTFEEMLSREMMQHDVYLSPSTKAALKATI